MLRQIDLQNPPFRFPNSICTSYSQLFMFWTDDKGISCTFFSDITAFRERSIKRNVKTSRENHFRVDCLFLASRVWYIFDSLTGESKDEPLGLNGLTVSIVAVVVYLLALLRLGVSIRLLHPGKKNPPPLPPMVKQNVEEDMGGEHTTERTEFMQANSRSTNLSSVADQQLYNAEP